MIAYEHRYSHTTFDELAFLRDYAARNPEGFAKYAAIILEDRRVFDSGVDVGKIRARVLELLAEKEPNA